MKIVQKVLVSHEALEMALDAVRDIDPHLVLVFGGADWLRALAPMLQARCARAIHFGCTTAGEISGQGVSDGGCVITAIHFQHTRLEMASAVLSDMQASFLAGQALAEQLPATDLRSVLVLGQGVSINGSQMIAGMTGVLGPQVLITGGLAGDDAAFRQTYVLTSKGVFDDQIACIGFYGDRLQVSHGSFGGWEPFGPARKVTRCVDNLLYELDGEPALDVYKRYLGDHARDLPASGLLFPFAMLDDQHQDMGLLRTILGVDESAGSLTLAGDIVNNGYLRLMHASTPALIAGAQTAALSARLPSQQDDDSLALLVSCVGRKLVMGGRVEEEVEAVAEVLSLGSVLTGFYSYGEISPLSSDLSCRLHNQTMTITCLSELSAVTSR